MYITVTVSNCIYVTDKTGKLLKDATGKDAIIQPLNSSNQPQQPRSALAYNGNVYVSTYDGDILRIDTTALTIDKKAATGDTYLEQMTIVGNKLYTVVSDYTFTGIGKSVAVVNLSSFTKEAEIPVALNPYKIKSDEAGNIYVLSMGNYGDIPSSLQKIDPNTNAVTTIGTNVASDMAVAGNRLLLMNSVYDFTTGTSSTVLSYYDIAANQIVDQPFVDAGTIDLSNTCDITYDPVTKYIYLAQSDYINEGNMYIFDENGEYLNSFKTGGMNPMGAYFVTGAKK
jgi:hypothetical protein